MPGRRVSTLRCRLLVVIPALLVVGVASAQVPSRNVNMVSGTDWPGGDPFLQRQNEPSVAVSTRNPMHLLAGANDYRTVDLPGLPGDRMTGDAWLGVFTSTDGGATWRSTLVPGYPQEANSTSPLHGLDAGADPVVRAGPHGLFYYSGIVFYRDNPVLEARRRAGEHSHAAGVADSSTNAVFLARYIDNNVKENGNPIAYLGTTLIANNTDPNTFLDKPWLSVDMPRLGAGTCTITQTLGGKTVTQTLPAGNVYAAYSQFTGKVSDGSSLGKLMFSRSTNCGATWSTPIAISGTHHINQGATIALDPRTGTVYVVWRRFAWPIGSKAPTERDALLIARSLDRGKTFGAPEVVKEFQPFDQPTASFKYQFRTSAYPTAGVDRFGRVLVAYSARGVQQPDGDARIVLTWARYPSRLRALFTSDDDDGTETTKTGDAQPSWTTPAPVDPELTHRGHQFMPSMLVTGLRVQIAWVDMQQDHTWGVYTRDPDTGQWVESQPRPQSDERTSSPTDVFNARINDADVHTRRHSADIWVAQADPGDRLAFTLRRASDYRAGTREDDRSVVQQLQFNPPNLPLFKQGSASFWGDYIDLGAQPLEQKARLRWRYAMQPPSAHVVFTDNRDVRAPADGHWEIYTPPLSPALNPSGTFEAGTPPLECDPAHPERAGMRNQNIYTARVSQGLYVAAPGNAKPLGKIQRAFVVSAENDTFVAKTFRMSIASQPAGGSASFKQFAPLTQLDLTIGPRSSVSRTVYVRSTDPRAQVNVDVREVSGGVIVPPTSGGLQGTAVLNPDSTTPDMMNPDMMNPDMMNPDVLSAEIYTPDMMNPDMMNPDMMNTDVNAAFLNPDMMNPDMMNTALGEAAGALTDTIWTLTNNGNTTAAYDLKLLLRGSSQVPDGFKTQLLLYKTYLTPIAKDCQLTQETQNVLIASVPDPPFGHVGDTVLFNPTDGSLGHTTLWLAPGESAKIALRVLDPDRHDDVVFVPATEVTPAVAPQPVDTISAAAGKRTPDVITVSPILFRARPVATPIGGYVTPPVEVVVEDDSGNPVSGVTVTLSLISNPGGATLHGGTAATGADGVATFSALWLDRLGHGYRLQATAGTRTSNDSGSFDVVPLVVTRTDDSEPPDVFPPPPTIPGSLRAALENANRNIGYRDEIVFDIPGPGPHTITLKHQAPTVTDPVVIDGTTQPGYDGSPQVRVECPSSANCIRGLWIQADNTTVRGLGVVNTLGGGIFIGSSTGALIEQNHIGTDGAADLGNGWGIDVVGGGSHTLRNNVISGNDGVGIDLSDTSGNVIQGNRIGTNAAGTAALGNAQQGVKVSGNSFGNVIGGPGAGQGNLISGNVEGVAVYAPAHDNSVEGNLVGTNAGGNAAIPNSVAGLHVSGGVNNTLIANHVAGNSGEGVLIDSGATGSVVQSNLIGLNAAQTAALANTGSGVAIRGAGTTGNSVLANTMSGNVNQGVDIRFQAHHNTLTDNHIGTNSSGTTAFGNQGSGILVGDNAYATTIGGSGHGNVISGNVVTGITLNATHDNVVLGNRIGTNDAGTTPLPNAGIGVSLSQDSLDRIGGAAAGEGNVISGNGGSGVTMSLTQSATIVGNRIGVDQNAGGPVPNGDAGISANDVNTLTIGGTTVEARNVISGNVGPGIRISVCSVATVQGNFVGTNGAGTAPIPNGGNGVLLVDTGRVTIGGSAPGAGNVISGQAGDGLTLSDAQLGVVDGNFIGTNATGTGPVPNSGPGVRLLGGSRDNLIGGGVTAAGNTVAFNDGAGILDSADAGTTNAFVSNRIHSNGGLGIDLAPVGPNPNDAGDGDTGPNDLLNFPVLTSAVDNGTRTTVSGSVDVGVPGATVTIQLFHNVTCDPSGYGEGQTPVGQTTVTTGAGGTATFVASLPGGLVSGYMTATTVLPPANTTSEFSACRLVVAPTVPLISFQQGPSDTPVDHVIAPAVVVWLRDTGGAAISGATVTLSIASGPGGATLDGATATSDVDGRATFTSLSVNQQGTFQLRATAAGITVDSTPFDVVPPVPLPGFTLVSAGSDHTCGLRADGTVGCWGSNASGESTSPGGAFTQVSAGQNHTCGVRSDGALACWGVNSVGESEPPTGAFTQVGAGALHTCGLKADGTVACWGDNYFGQSTPPAGTFTQVSAGTGNTCGLKSDGTVACWGWNDSGQSTPPTGTFTQVDAGYSHTCGLKSDGTVACWGADDLGQSTPPAGTFSQVSAGFKHTCGVKSDGSVACWGDNASGQSTPPAGTFAQVSAGRIHTCAARGDGTAACWGSNESGQSSPLPTPP
ncbi:MAG TPA: NosD domain-containing protein, partial [Vicinamibacteria bacterium]|nr:NosD domain-containing protein [Vicinamibacteria bacterium]